MSCGVVVECVWKKGRLGWSSLVFSSCLFAWWLVGEGRGGKEEGKGGWGGGRAEGVRKEEVEDGVVCKAGRYGRKKGAAKEKREEREETRMDGYMYSHNQQKPLFSFSLLHPLHPCTYLPGPVEGDAALGAAHVVVVLHAQSDVVGTLDYLLPGQAT